MQVKQFVFNHFQTNSYVIYTTDTKQCAIVDPCCHGLAETEALTQWISQQQLVPIMVLVTHPHVDHICGLREVFKAYGLPVMLHPEGKHLLQQAGDYASVMGFNVDDLSDLPTIDLSDDQVLTLGNEKIECRFVPGHCPGSMAFVLHEEKMVITGDTLFRGSIGRTDLPGGSLDALMQKLQTRILTLDDAFMVLPGHGDLSTIGEEHLYNDFLQDF